MTYKELALRILALTPEQQDTDVTVRIDRPDEYIPCFRFGIMEETNGILDEGHPFLSIDI